MILIKNVLVSDELVTEKFACELNACKGACCWEGDFGAPLEKQEIEILNQMGDTLHDYLPARSKEFLASNNGHRYYKGMEKEGTAIHPDGACVYLNYTESGMALCGIEQAWRDGKTAFRKPISCHLYPIRIEKDDRVHFEAMNYDRWDICSAACNKGERDKIAVYQFAKDAIIRKYGEEFYEELDAAAKHQQTEQ